MESQCKWTIFPENVLSLNCSVTLAGWQCVIWGVSVVLLSRNLHVSGKSFLHAIAQGDLVYHGYVSLSILFGEMIAVHQQRGATNISQFRASCQTRLVCRSAIKQIFCLLFRSPQLTMPEFSRVALAVYDRCNLVDPASSHMLVSKFKPCMSKYKFFTAKLWMAHYNSYHLLVSQYSLGHQW